MKNNIYLIDTENVHEEWLGKIEILKRDQVVIFYGETCTISYEHLEQLLILYSVGKLEFVHTKAGKNSMDFYIVAKLVSMLYEMPNCKYHIISNDHGYDPLLSDIVKHGIAVDRIPIEKIVQKANLSITEKNRPNRITGMSGRMS